VEKVGKVNPTPHFFQCNSGYFSVSHLLTDSSSVPKLREVKWGVCVCKHDSYFSSKLHAFTHLTCTNTFSTCNTAMR